jgi:hypothetical protein
MVSLYNLNNGRIGPQILCTSLLKYRNMLLTVNALIWLAVLLLLRVRDQTTSSKKSTSSLLSVSLTSPYNLRAVIAQSV